MPGDENNNVTDDAAKAAADTAAAAAAAAGEAAAKESADKAVADKAAADKAAADAAAAAAPATYTLKLPDGSKADPAIVERTATNARALGLSNDAAQQLLDSVVAELTTSQTAATAAREAAIAAEQKGGEAWTARVTGWEAQALADTEVGGTPENLKVSVEKAQAVISKYFPDETKAFLEETGLGSHPVLLKGLARIGKAMAEGAIVMPGRTGGEPSNKERLDRLYPSMASKS